MEVRRSRAPPTHSPPYRAQSPFGLPPVKNVEEREKRKGWFETRQSPSVSSFRRRAPTYVVHNIVVGIAQGCDEELIPKRGSVGLVIEKAHGGIRPRRNGLADHVHRLRIGARPLQEPTITTQDFLAGIAREFVKSRAGKDDGIVRKFGVGQDEALLSQGQTLHEGKVRAHNVLEFVVVVRGIVIVVFKERVRRAAVGNDLEGVLGHVRLHHEAEALVLALQVAHLTLQRFQHELFADAAALGVFPVPLPPLGRRCVNRRCRSGGVRRRQPHQPAARRRADAADAPRELVHDHVLLLLLQRLRLMTYLINCIRSHPSQPNANPDRQRQARYTR